MNHYFSMPRRTAAALALLLSASAPVAATATKTESFDRDPAWEGVNNRTAAILPPVTVRQDYGFDEATRSAGGHLSQAAESTYYAAVIEPKTFDDVLTASGTLVVRHGGTPEDTGAHLLLGFFNADTINEWRTPNTVAIRISARGDTFIPFLEYYTSQWRIGTIEGGNDLTDGKSGNPKFMTGDKIHRWTLEFDPQANGGKGVMTASIGDAKAVYYTNPAYLADGATFNRFGILNVMKAASKKEGGSEIYLDDVTINGGKIETFDADPKWKGKGNRRTYQTRNVRPRFDFGYSGETNVAGGESAGEIGGRTFRGDIRYPERMAYYGDRVGPLTLDKPFKASGKLALARGVTDSTTMFGFFNSKTCMEVTDRQNSATPRDFAGICIEGPSSEGFHFYPSYRNAAEGQGNGGRAASPLPIHPDGGSHDWSLEYDPAGAEGKGTITITLDGRTNMIELGEGHKQTGATFDRFGFITPWIDGNGQTVYLDDLTYTVSQHEGQPQ